MEEIESLRQQLHAAQFLANSLQAKLQQAEAQYAATQQFHSHSIPRSNTALNGSGEGQAGGSSNLDPSLRPQSGDQAGLNSSDNGFTQGDDLDMGGGADDDGDELQLDDDPSSPPPAPEPQAYPIPEGMELPNVTVKTVFPSLADVKAAVEQYAVIQGWTSATKKRDRMRICMGCRTVPDCTFHVRAETCADGARISACKMEHSCFGVATGPPKRNRVTHLRFLREEVPKLLEVTRETPTKDIQDAVFQRFGQRISLSQCAKVRGRVRSRRPAFQGCSICGEAGHNKLTCKSEMAMAQAASGPQG